MNSRSRVINLCKGNLNMDSNDYVKLLGKKGIFKRGTDENWMVRLGSLTAVQNVKGVVLYYDEQNNGFDNFSVLGVNSKEVSDSKEVKENHKDYKN